MSIASHYEINVSLVGRHYFATHPRSLTSKDWAWEVLEDFKRRFPASEGFKVTMTFWEAKGHSCA
jgi:hypothetical protein